MNEQKVFVSIDKIFNWDKNPRTITDEGKKHLKSKLLRLGQFKPLIVIDTGGGRVHLPWWQYAVALHA